MKRKTIYLYGKTFFSFLLLFFISFSSNSQCTQNYAWTKWTRFADSTATGLISPDSQVVTVTMSSNFAFGSTPGIYNYQAFSRFKGIIPDSTVPETTWAAGAGGRTTMCFSQPVYNPVLLLASLGNGGIHATLKFSRKYLIVYDGGGMSFTSDSTLTGFEGYAIIVFPGKFDCVTINSTTPEYYTNISWGLNPPLFPVTVTKEAITCNSVTYKATGGNIYSWSGGDHPDSSVNTFRLSGTYFLAVTDTNGCKVSTSVDVIVTPKIYTEVSDSIIEGGNYFGHTLNGIYLDTLKTYAGCDSIRKINLIVKPKPVLQSNSFRYLLFIFSGILLVCIIILFWRRRKNKKDDGNRNENLS